MTDHETSISPTAHRLQHGPVELLERAQDEEGRVSRPYRAIDILASLERRGAITGTMRGAADIFQDQFTKAHLEPLVAADVSRPIVSGRRKRTAELPEEIEDARESVYKATRAVGGLASIGGSCLWHVLGWGYSLKDWKTFGLLGERTNQTVALGVLIAVLSALEEHYDLRLTK